MIEVLIVSSVVASVIGLLRRGTPDGAWLLGSATAILLVLVLMYALG